MSVDAEKYLYELTWWKLWYVQDYLPEGDTTVRETHGKTTITEVQNWLQDQSLQILVWHNFLNWRCSPKVVTYVYVRGSSLTLSTTVHKISLILYVQWDTVDNFSPQPPEIKEKRK